jgi:hypothetical protein
MGSNKSYLSELGFDSHNYTISTENSILSRCFLPNSQRAERRAPRKLIPYHVQEKAPWPTLNEPTMLSTVSLSLLPFCSNLTAFDVVSIM